ncbi:MAG: tyrosine-protein phosphatase [Bifidobacteriaceae bacterium]|jgi:protein-tyrosine phosphatase|nr:tyrosine-protein phosphatase [Bifidobacteriaceae bacterium]
MSSDNFDELVIPGTFNVRDIGSRWNSSPILPKKLLRTALLSHLTSDGQAKVEQLGVDVVIDLRSIEEINRDGVDKLPSSIDHVWLPINTTSDDDVTPDVAKVLDKVKQTEDSRIKQIHIMKTFYKKFVTVPSLRYIYGEVLDILANYNYPLFHCTAGKDRTGWVSVLCHHIAGSSKKTIIEDYLLSNKTAKLLWKNMPLQSRGDYKEQKPALGVDMAYLQSSFDEIDRLYGNIDNYIDDLGVSSGVISKLASRITTENIDIGKE